MTDQPALSDALTIALLAAVLIPAFFGEWRVGLAVLTAVFLWGVAV